MKPPRFRYSDPTTVAEVVGHLEQHADETKLLAGGQSLMPVIAMRLARPEYVVDVNRVAELDYVREHDGALAIGALTRQDALLHSREAIGACPLLADALPYVGHLAIRYRGTAGGSIVHADPSAELPALVTVLDGELVVRGPQGERSIPARDFFLSYFMTSIEPEEMLVEVRLPAQPVGAGTSVKELARRHGDFALAGVMTQVVVDGGRIDSARLCAFGVDDVPLRLDDVETLLGGQAPTAELLDEAGALAARAVDPESDMHASGDYRRRMTGVLVRRALHDALGDAGAPLHT